MDACLKMEKRELCLDWILVCTGRTFCVQWNNKTNVKLSAVYFVLDVYIHAPYIFRMYIVYKNLPFAQ